MKGIIHHIINTKWGQNICFVLTFLLLSAGNVMAVSRDSLSFVTGAAPNGLSYYIASSPEWRNEKTEIRLVLPVGAMAEELLGRGVAHFIEHMAFAGTHSFPDREIRAFIERQGGVFGFDLNALTGFDRTLYMMSLPSSAIEKIDTALLITKEWLGELSFTHEMIEQERSIIKEEIRSYQELDPFYQVKMGVGPHLNALPLGTLHAVDEIDREALITFYQKWYVPSLASLVIVGDIDIEQVEESIHRVMACDSMASARKAPPFPRLKYKESISGLIVPDSLYQNHQLELIFPIAIPRFYDEQGFIQEQRLLLATSILSHILTNEVQAELTYHWYLKGTAHLTLSLKDKEERHLMQRLSKAIGIVKGFVENDIEISDTLFQHFSERVTQRVKRLSYYDTPLLWSDCIVEHILIGEPLITNVSDERALKSRVSQALSKENVMSELRSALDKADAPIIAYRQGKSGVLQLTELIEAVHAANPIVLSLQSLQVTSSHLSVVECGDEASSAIRYFVDGFMTEQVSPISIVRTPNLGVTQAQYPNGTTLLVAPTPQDRSGMLRLTYLGQKGLDILPDSLYARCESMAGYVDMGSVGEYSSSEWYQLLESGEISLGSVINPTSHGFYAVSSKDSVRLLLSAMMAKMYAPNISTVDLEEVKDDLLQQINKPSLLKSLLANTDEQNLRLLKDSILGNVLRPIIEPSKEDIMLINKEELELWYRAVFGNVRESVTIITGDVNVEEVVEAFSKTIGTVPIQSYSLQRMVEPTFPHASNISIPEKSHKVDEQITMHYLFWGAFKPSLKNGLILKLTQELIRQELVKSLREELGLVYSPYITLEYTCDVMGRGRFYYDFENSLTASNKDKLGEAILALWQKVCSEPSEASKIEEIKKTFQLNKERALAGDNPTAWQSTLTSLIQKDEHIYDLDRYDEILSSISAQEIIQFWQSHVSELQSRAIEM